MSLQQKRFESCCKLLNGLLWSSIVCVWHWFLSAERKPKLPKEICMVLFCCCNKIILVTWFGQTTLCWTTKNTIFHFLESHPSFGNLPACQLLPDCSQLAHPKPNGPKTSLIVCENKQLVSHCWNIWTFQIYQIDIQHHSMRCSPVSKRSQWKRLWNIHHKEKLLFENWIWQTLIEKWFSNLAKSLQPNSSQPPCFTNCFDLF